MSQNQAKVIQSRLKNRGKKFTLEQLRTYIFTHYHDEELTEDQMSAIVEKLSGSSMVPVGADELSHSQKQALIQQVASALEVALPIEQIKQISQKIDWAIASRVSLKDQIQAAIIAWVDYQIDQDNRQTDEMMQAVESHLTMRLQESNQHFNHKAFQFSKQVDEAVEKFRTTEAEILSIFKIPS